MSLLLLLGGAEPNPRTLFANGEQGLAVDVEEAYLRGWVWQDANAVTRAAAAGDPVGLILDSSRGGLDGLGSELVTNGTFTTNTTGWTAANSAVLSVVGGQISIVNGAADYGAARQTITTVAGRWYQVSYDFVSVNGARGFFNVGTFAGNNGLYASGAIASSRSSTVVFLATQTSSFLSMGHWDNNAATEVRFDNISIREIPGNHAYVTASGSRPVLARTPDGGRRNLLVQTESFDNASWTKDNTTVTANSAVAPNNTTSADKVVASADNAEIGLYQSQTAGVVYTFSVWVKSATGSNVACQIGGASSNLTFTAFNATTEWVRYTNTVTSLGGNRGSTLRILNNGGEVYVWGAQLETGSSATAYQKVGLTSDVTESGKRDCWGLLFDGSDDSLITASVDFSATDKITVMAGVRKLSDAGTGCVAELSTSLSSNNGTFILYNPASAGYGFTSKGTTGRDAAVSVGYASPITNTVTATGNISGDVVLMRLNGTQVSITTDEQGSGNYGNYALYIGSRAGSSLRYNGIIYSLIVRGATTPTGTIADFEKNLLARRAGLLI